jgi:hypothetical protein
MAGLVPAIPIQWALCLPKRDARHKAGHDNERTQCLMLLSIKQRHGEIDHHLDQRCAGISEPAR